MRSIVGDYVTKKRRSVSKKMTFVGQLIIPKQALIWGERCSSGESVCFFNFFNMKVLLAGSTGYLGTYILKELQARQIDFRAITRNVEKLKPLGLYSDQLFKAQVTQKESLLGACDGVEVVISTVGITRQKDGLTYMDVDYQANRNLLDEAIRAKVKKFIYVSVLEGQNLTHLQICAAKERFVHDLKQSGLDYSIIRPTGFFSDMKAFYEMTQRGRIYLFGDGSIRSNPIHGADLAKICVDAIESPEQEIKVGGPETLTQSEIAQLAFEAIGRPAKITYLPDWLRRGVLRLASIFQSKANYGTTEFFLNVLAMDMVAPQYGRHRLGDLFSQLHHQALMDKALST